MGFKDRALVSIIFSVFALLSTLAILLATGIIWGQKLSFLIKVFHVFSAASVLMPSFLLANLIQYKSSKYRNLPVCILVSLLIVIISLIIWAGLAYLILPDYEILPAAALMAGTIIGYFTYIPGIIAGLLVWWWSKYNKRSHSDKMLTSSHFSGAA